MKYERLQILGYRGWGQLTVSDLGTINLFVGRNNAGKTSVLECLDYLETNNHATSLVRVAERREELLSVDSERKGYRDLRMDMSRFVHRSP